MDPKEEKTLYAALRLVKSRMRRYIWEHKTANPSTAYHTMVSLEETIEETAKGEWDAALAEWDCTDPEQRLRVKSLVGEAFYRATQDLLNTFDGVASLLSEYVATHASTDILGEHCANG